jgi:methyl halide transferase
MKKLIIPNSAKISWNSIEDLIVERDDQESIFLATFDDVASNIKNRHQIDYSYYNSGKFKDAPKFILHVYTTGIDYENYSDTINHFDKEYDLLNEGIEDINYWLHFFKDYMSLNKTENYWTNRYKDQSTGWDLGEPSMPLKIYIDQLENKEISILIPGAGNAYEAEYLIELGFKNVFVMDISKIPLDNFRERNPDFPDDQLLETDFFEHDGKYDLIIEQTFFCSFEPTQESRKLYGQKMAELLNPNGKLVGLWFDIPLIEGNFEKRPFGGNKTEYLTYLEPFFEVKTFEKCYNSIKPRENQELFGVFLKK